MTFEWSSDAAAACGHFIKAPSNADARKWLAQTGWPDKRLLVWGPEATGKTHLLHAWAARRGGCVMRAQDIDIRRLNDAQALAIDQLDAGFDPLDLLHFINTARERGKILLFAAREPPVRIPIALPDLASRLKAITAVAIKVPEDALRIRLLMQLSASRQLCMGQDVAVWLLRRLPRTNAAILKTVQMLDAASLRSKRPLTRAFVAHELADLFAHDHETCDTQEQGMARGR